MDAHTGLVAAISASLAPSHLAATVDPLLEGPLTKVPKSS